MRYPGYACVQVLMKPPDTPSAAAAIMSDTSVMGPRPITRLVTAEKAHTPTVVLRGPMASMTEPAATLPIEVARLRTSVIAATRKAVPARS